MTDERLAELERLCAAATPGPWLPGGEEMAVVRQDGKDVIGSCGCCASPYGENAVADRPFILAARTALPELIAEVRRLRAVEARLDREEEYRAEQNERGQ